LSMRSPADLSDPIGPGWAEEVGRDITALGGNAVLTLLTLAVVGYLLLDGKRKVALVLIIASLGALGVSTLLMYTIAPERPDLVPHHTKVYTASFPSGHSMLSASTFLTMGALLARVQKRKRMKAYILLVAITATLLVGLSRIYLGVHWPTDVLADWTAGSAWAVGCWLLAPWQQHSNGMDDDDTSCASFIIASVKMTDTPRAALLIVNPISRSGSAADMEEGNALLEAAGIRLIHAASHSA